ncbi:PriCT-2 domain-containing protein [Denitrificimonas caeni]|uniref:PriCT-2 domain-containing protein n=1 Tax=Denitrificimonas caeni TaxID=521720 RepID=UPI0019634222|nr:PriCT-2 domain-containing protein [Denitrificimonas caeni]
MNELLFVTYALQYLDSHDRSTWVKAAMALKSEFGEAAFHAWNDWSKQADNYKESAALAVWKSCKSTGGVGIGTLLYLARENGWQPNNQAAIDPVEFAARKLAIESERKEAEAYKLHRQKQAATKAQYLWCKSDTASAGHSYLLKKNVSPLNLRQSEGVLLVPLSANGVLMNLQRIYPNGTKRFLAAGKVHGCYSAIGHIKAGQPLYICEGWATGASIHADTGHAVACAMNAGNLLSVGRQLSLCYPDSILIIAGDDDRNTEAEGKGNPGVEAATQTAIALGCAMVLPAFPADAPLELSDFNDLAQWRASR